MIDATHEPQPDPGGAQSAIDRYRDLAKYLITILAAVAGLLLAGTQLASIGTLSWDDEKGRVLAATLGLLAALGAVVWIVWRAVGVLRPVEMSLDDVIADGKLKADLAARPSLLAGAASIEDVRSFAGTTLLSEEERQRWLEVAHDITARAAYRTTELRFEGALRQMIVAGIVGAAGIAAFAWGGNPPEEMTHRTLVRPTPALVTVGLTSEGRAALRGTIGGACAARRFRALSIGGTEQRPRIVVLPEQGCRQAQILLAPVWGAATSSTGAPVG